MFHSFNEQMNQLNQSKQLRLAQTKHAGGVGTDGGFGLFEGDQDVDGIFHGVRPGVVFGFYARPGWRLLV